MFRPVQHHQRDHNSYSGTGKITEKRSVRNVKFKFRILPQKKAVQFMMKDIRGNSDGSFPETVYRAVYLFGRKTATRHMSYYLCLYFGILHIVI